MAPAVKLPPKVIVCLSQGRSGTKYLSRVMSLFPGTAVYHEPQPDFTDRSLAAQGDNRIALNFLLEAKLPAIGRASVSQAYIETSHMWCAGLAKAWIELAIRPSLNAIILDRPINLIAKSMYSLGITPGLDPWYLDPTGPDCLLKYKTTANWNCYHKCYAYCLEIEARKKHLAQLLQEHGGRTVRINLGDLPTWRGLLSLQRGLSLRLPALPQLYTFCFLKRQKLNEQKYVKDAVGAIKMCPEEMLSFGHEVESSVSNTDLLA